MYLCRKTATTGTDSAVMVNRTASARYNRHRPNVYNNPAWITSRVLPALRPTYEIAAMFVANGQGLIDVSRPKYRAATRYNR
jgi:hypothetical protein